MRNRVTSLLRGPWGWRTKWRLYAGVATALVVAGVLVVPGGGGSKDQLLANDPTPAATLDATPTPTPTPTTSSMASPDVAAETSPTGTAEARPPAPHLDAEHLLSSRFVEASFGQDRSSIVGTWETPGAPSACRSLVGLAGSDHLARIWAWPDEVVFGETFARAGDDADAMAWLKACRTDGAWSGKPDTSETLAVHGTDGAYLTTRRHPLFTELQAGVRIGRALVLLVWRQSGPVTDSGPLERALRNAVALTLDEPVAEPVAAPAQRTPEPLRGFLKYGQLRNWTQLGRTRWDGMSWETDGQAAAAGITCNADSTPTLPTRDRPVTRTWVGGVLNGNDFPQVRLSFATAEDDARAAEDFAACRQAAADMHYGTTTVRDVGDEAFVVDWLDGQSPNLYARSGSTYLVLRTHWAVVDNDIAPIAREALKTYLTARTP